MKEFEAHFQRSNDEIVYKIFSIYKLSTMTKNTFQAQQSYEYI